MKSYMKLFLAAAALFAAAVVASAIPAKPGTFKYKQPDGTVIELRRHGDEFFSWTTRASDGQVMVLGKDRYYRPGTIDLAAKEEGRKMRQMVNDYRKEFSLSKGVRTHNNNPMTHGERHIPVILVEFSDLGFVIDDPAGSFDKLLNQNGYSGYNGTGSVRDFYYDNSHGAFEPKFDVYGPVTLSKDMAYYGTVRSNAALAVAEGAKLLHDLNLIDFSNYDHDNDGEVDMILMYYPGHNPAEWGPENNIWPHQWYVNGKTIVRLDGKLLSRYFCTSELRGNEGARMCGIGTTTHEFAHSLGVPDFYDTDYSENGECGALYHFSVMDSGSYVNDGRTPPYFNSEERIILGWLSEDDIPVLPDGSVTLASIKDNYAYRSYTDTEGEYFLYECRDGSGWDAYIPSGLLVYHVDKSTVRTVGGITPYEQWTDWGHHNKINAYADHPCFYVVAAADPSSLRYLGEDSEMVFPGSYNIQTYSPFDWNGYPTGTDLSLISYNGGQVSFNASTSQDKLLAGYVRDASGNGIADAEVTVTKGEQAQQVRGQFRIAPRTPSSSLTAITDSDGAFSIDLSSFDSDVAHVTVSKTGFAMLSKDVSISERGARVYFTLYPEVDGSELWLQYFDPDADMYVYGLEIPSSMCSIKLPAEELARFEGRKIDRVKTGMNCDSADEVYIIAETSNGTRLLNHKVTNPTFNEGFEIDLSSENLVVPKGQDLYMGLALKNASYKWPFIIFAGRGHAYFANYSLSGNVKWGQLTGYDLYFKVHLAEAEGDPHEKYEQLAASGYNVIYPGDSFTHVAGEEFQLILYEAPGDSKPTSVEWQYDGKTVSGTSVKLTKGTHKISANLVLADGRLEVVNLDITAQ